MKIGTPLSENSTKVMLLGSGELGKEVIIALQRLGIEVIAVDRYPNAPGQQVAHRSYVIDMTDKNALIELISSEKPHLVIPEIEAIATEALAEIENKGKCEVIPTARATQLTMNRKGIRSLAAEELELPTSQYAFADSLEQLIDIIENPSNGINLPCFIKPVMSSSGKGQSLIKATEDIKTAWEYALTGGRVNKTEIIVEEKIEFDFEITLLTVRAKNANDGSIHTYFCEPIGHKQENGDYVESWQPQAMSALALERAQAVAKSITDNLGGRGLFGVELFVKDDDVWFSEVSPRPHDTGMVTMATQKFNEFELHARAVLGLPVCTDLMSAGASAVIYGGYDTKTISFSDIDKALANPNTDLRLFGKPESYKKRRMGVALAHADQVSTARELAKNVASTIKTHPG